jgi:NTE family protein
MIEAVATTRRGEARTYEEWSAAARAEDERLGGAAWRRVDSSRHYDYRLIRSRLDELRRIRECKDPHRLFFYLHEGVHGNMGNMGSSTLYSHAKFGTKNLITEYIHELVDAFDEIALVDEDEISFAEKLEFFTRASSCFGHAALMFSGAGSLGPFHLGVARALVQQGLLPKVLSGASAGAFVVALLGTHTDEQLEEYFDSDDYSRLFDQSGTSAEPGQRISESHLHGMVAELIPDITFEEAFDLTGRKINISVSPNELYQRSRMLNGVTSPNVFIREAVIASCAIPGVFPPVTLAAKNAEGERQDYNKSLKWIDGSVTDDQPSERLARLYQANFFIASQTNPVVLWALRDKGWENSLPGRLWDVYRSATKEWFRATYPFAMALTRNAYPLNVVTRFGYAVATQDYTADVNIMPEQRFWDPRKLLSVLSEKETLALVQEGERATWPKIEMIRNCSLISLKLDRLLVEMQERIEESAIPRLVAVG